VNRNREVEEKFLTIVARALDVGRKDVHMSSTLFGELGAESLDLLDLAFTLEMEFRIRLPRTDLLFRAGEYFGEKTVMNAGVITPTGLEIIRRSMPEVDPAVLVPGLTAMEFRDFVQVESLYRVVRRLLDAKENCVCEVCSAKMIGSTTEPELVCPECGETQPLPSGEKLLVEDLEKIARDLGCPAPLRETAG